MATTTLPDTFRFPRLEDSFSVFPDNGLNPHYAECRPQGHAWIGKFYDIACGPKMRVFMEKCSFELVTAYCYPYAGPVGLRKAMDVVNVLWLYDEYTDTLSGEDAALVAIVVERSLREQNFDDGSWVCQMMREFRINNIEKFGPNLARRFTDRFCTYTKATATEAKHRENDQVLDINGYRAMRREASGVGHTFDVVEYCLGLDLPQYVYDDPVFHTGYMAAMDIDLTSYNMEQSKKHGAANVVTVVMKARGLDLQSSFDFMEGYLECLTQQLLNACSVLATRNEPIFSKDAVRLLEGLGIWIQGHYKWNFETERFFGKDKKSVKETRIVKVRKLFEDVAILEE